jgi:hypothetical protein
MRPGNNNLIADIGMDLPVVVGNRLIDVEKEPGDQIDRDTDDPGRTPGEGRVSRYTSARSRGSVTGIL